MVTKAPRSASVSDRAAALARIRASTVRGELVAVIGTGVSVGLTNNTIPALSWKGLVRHGFAHGVKKGLISAQQLKIGEAQLESTDLDDLLAAAEFMGRKLDAPTGDLYARWLENVFKDVQPANRKLARAVRALRAAGVPLCTLNYDPLLERVTGLPAVTLGETAKVGAWVRRESDGILHLHGSWDAPATCVLGVRDYEKTLSNDVRDLIQRSLAAFRRLLFIGCGDTFADPNLSALITWLRGHLGTAAPEHYALVTDGELASRNADPSWQGFVEPLAYGGSHADVSRFLIEQFEGLARNASKSKPARSKSPAASSGHTRLLNDYRAFMVKDCGQMTIEGLRADMDTAQRRFDLEQLFVPIKVAQSPPAIAANDPKREEKLRKWRAEDEGEVPFGTAFAARKRLVLLALPGGGKSLLLKRLAVAYADPARRRASVDGLPDLDLTPVMIRCREWREHVHRPLLTLLGNIPDITGQPALAGLSGALIPLFKAGRALLLVDGLDEIHDDGLRTIFVDHLDTFLRDHPRTRMVITSREAGFNLVAPGLARFCTQWRIAPLDADAITALSDLWHRLMTGDSPESRAEAQQFSRLLVRSDSLKRLAENPLLLTMLLVVKAGGRLPLDRVSLYGRAVDVLLDTWNIRGHAPLSLNEAVPQLAYVAFQLMRAGKQTATAKELLSLLDKAREQVPHIRRYAKDTPEEFLKRVELRSSLLVEAGHQLEGSGPVPFYQFRHLTFQEYLAAVAAVEGHYPKYKPTDTVLTPLSAHLTAEEWKEVIPMSAVLAGKRAKPIIEALVEAGNAASQSTDSFTATTVLPAPVARIAQCLVEGAVDETPTAALRLLALHCRGCSSNDDWQTLGYGPYGEDLFLQAWLLYAPMTWDDASWMDATCAGLAVLRQPEAYWASDDGRSDLRRRLKSRDSAELGRALLTCAGLRWFAERHWLERYAIAAELLPLAEVEAHIFQDDPAIWHAAVWAWTLIWSSLAAPGTPSSRVLDRILHLWLSNLGKTPRGLVTPFGIADLPVFPRKDWTPKLTPGQVTLVQQVSLKPPLETRPDSLAACRIAFHAGNVCSEAQLATRLLVWRTKGRGEQVGAMLAQMRPSGKRVKTRQSKR